MTFRITTAFDVRYNCPTGHNANEGITDFDKENWTCNHCQLPLRIEMRDRAGNFYVVERHPVNTLRPGDYIVYSLGNNQIACAKVHNADWATGSTTQWQLRVEGFGSPLIPAGHRVNRI